MLRVVTVSNMEGKGFVGTTVDGETIETVDRMDAHFPLKRSRKISTYEQLGYMVTVSGMEEDSAY